MIAIHLGNQGAQCVGPRYRIGVHDPDRIDCRVQRLQHVVDRAECGEPVLGVGPDDCDAVDPIH